MQASLGKKHQEVQVQGGAWEATGEARSGGQRGEWVSGGADRGHRGSVDLGMDFGGVRGGFGGGFENGRFVQEGIHIWNRRFWGAEIVG